VSRIFLALVIVVAIGVGAIALARITSRPIASIQCDPTEQVTYHVHAYLSILERGQIHHPPANIGIDLPHLCLYWLHTHDDSGIIHIEAPHRISPTLGQFFAVWGEPLTRKRVASYVVRPGEQMRVFLGAKPYRRNPGSIVLHNHTVVTIEIGPPFRPPVRGRFKGY
jgi:hypothetical protein